MAPVERWVGFTLRGILLPVQGLLTCTFKNIENVKGHPIEFYLDVGYHIVGVIPDFSGFGRHDILMAKRIKG